MIGIYKIENILDGKKYIGSSVNIKKRFIRHKCDLNRGKHHNIFLQRSYNLYGKNNFNFEIIEECSLEELKIVEQRYLDNIFTNENYNDYYYNLSKGAYGGDNLTNNPNKEEIIEKIKKGVLDKLNNESKEDKLKRIEKIKGNKNPNWKGGISNPKCKKCNKIIGNGHSYCSKCVPKSGENNPFYKKNHTQETKDKISSKRKGSKPTNMTPVIIDDILYESLNEASRKLNIHITTIRFRINSKNTKFEKYHYP